MKDFAIKGNICFCTIPGELKIYENSYVVCIDGKSKGVFRELPGEYSSLTVKDYGNKIIIPGLVDLHTHAPQYAYCGTGMDMELMDWLNAVTFPEEIKYENLDYAKRAYQIFADKLKRGATTRAVIFATRHVPATIILMDLLEETGIKACVGKVNMDRGAPEALLTPTEDSVKSTIEWLREIEGKYERVKPILTPRFIPCCSDELLRELGQIQKSFCIPVQSHLSENPEEIETVKKLRPDTRFYGEGYEVFELFGRTHSEQQSFGTIMAHCVYSTEEEAALMKKNGVFVAHCPTSNTELSSGIAPIRKYLNMDMRIGLGTDIAGGHSDSIFRAMTDAISASKMYWRLIDHTLKPLSFEEAFYLATKGGGAFFGQVGSLEDGYEFDALVLDDSHLPHPQEISIRERLERFAYLDGDQQGIVAKYVAGKPIINTSKEYKP